MSQSRNRILCCVIFTTKMMMVDLSLFFVLMNFSILVNGSLIDHRNATTNGECPTWYVHDNESCLCGNTINNKTKCLPNERIGLAGGNCMTYTNGDTLLGACPYSKCINIYTTLPNNVSDLDDFMCDWMNRTGVLCSQCKSGLSVAVLSYEQSCVQCSNSRIGAVKFLLLAFVPTTAFFFVVMCCRIDISSGPLNAFLILIQTSLVIFEQGYSHSLLNVKSHKVKLRDPFGHSLVIFFLTFYGIWNLDFFRYIIPPFCVNESLTLLQAKVLEYVIAAYPLFLVVLTYILVELYDNGNCLIAPFKKIFKFPCFLNLNIKYSLLTTFATFIQLPYTKILAVSISLLKYTHLQNSSGQTVKTVVEMDASITYFSSDHIPYAMVAIFMITVFNLVPFILLLFYPTKCFQLLLGRFPRVNWHPLHAFMDIFQSCYKNGMDGTRDYRYFAALNFLVRIIILIPIDNTGVTILQKALTHLLYGFLIAVAKPYHKHKSPYNVLDAGMFVTYSLFSWMAHNAFISRTLFGLFSCVVYFALLVYICALMIIKTVSLCCSNPSYSTRRFEMARYKVSNYLCCMMTDNGANLELLCDEGARSSSTIIDDNIPDRVANPQDYQPLLAQIGNGSAAPSYGVL